MDFSKLICGDIFIFLVGPERQEIKVHVDAISPISKPLTVLMDGRWKEGKERKSALPDVDVDTFVDIMKFAYTGTYNAELLSVVHEKWSALNGKSRQSIVSLQLISTMMNRIVKGSIEFWCRACKHAVSTWSTDTWSHGCSTCCRDAPEPDHFNLTSQCCSLCGDDPHNPSEDCGLPLDGFLSSLDPKLCEPMRGDRREDCLRCLNVLVFAGDEDNRDRYNLDELVPNLDTTLDQIRHHCSIYIFADTYDISNIQCYSLCWIWLHLSVIRYHRMQYRDGQDLSGFVDVMQHVFANTRRSGGMDLQGRSTDKLCQLITTFAVLERDSLMRLPKFTQLIDENPDVMKELFLAALRSSRKK